MGLREHWKFFSGFIRHPKAVSSVAPSSSVLARAMADRIDWDRTAVLVEYGPGTGPITQVLVERIGEATRFLAIELDPKFAREVAARFPRVTVCEGSVADAARFCREHHVEQVDAIISGLPWASFSDELQTSFLDATREILRPGGQFVTFGYLQGRLLSTGRRFRRKLDEYFSEVRTSRPIWRNIPPAFFYDCRK